MFIQRVHENGGICCSSPYILCDTCKAYFADRAAEPPDPYAEGIATLRAAQQLGAEPWREAADELDSGDAANDYDAPDPYAAGVAAMRGAR